MNDFTHWKTLNGFGRAGVTNAVYQNLYDLGFGRDMYMQTGGQNGTCPNCIAYYVTNYDSPDNAATHGTTGQKATVGMEYSPKDGLSGTPYTKFYVFNADGSIANSVALDDFAPKFVPTLCIICHNGNIASMDTNAAGPTPGNLVNSRFIPFDLQSFGYAAALPPGSQDAQFKALNNGIVNNTNRSAAVLALVTHWYGTEGDTTLPGSFNASAVPNGWTSPTDESNLYDNVVKLSCRTCHNTRDPADTGFDISWGSYDSLNVDSAFARILACSTAAVAGPSYHLMPQAERTFSRFWLSTNPNGPLALGNSGMTGFLSPNNNCN